MSPGHLENLLEGTGLFPHRGEVEEWKLQYCRGYASPSSFACLIGGHLFDIPGVSGVPPLCSHEMLPKYP